MADINPPDIPPGSEPPVSDKARPQNITLCRIRTQYDVVFCYRKGGSESEISGLADGNPPDITPGSEPPDKGF